MFDMEVLRNKQLIEERIEYENEFISISDIIKSEELDCYTTPQYEEYFDGDSNSNGGSLVDDFEFEEFMIQLRDEQLIKEREAQELSLEMQIEEYYADYDPLGAQIESLNEYCPNFDYFNVRAYEDYIKEVDMILDQDFIDEDYVEEINMDAAYCGNELCGYVVDDYDCFDEFDYPEGPDENLSGFTYPELDYPDDYFDFSIPDIELPDEIYDCPETEYNMDDEHGEYLFETEELHMKKLISQHLKEEKEFLEFVKENEIPDEYFIPKGMDDIIIC